MVAGIRTSWAIFAIAGIVLSGCVTTGSLSSSAERLERSTYSLEKTAHFDRASSVQRDAQDLSEDAQDFRRTLADSRADRRDVDVAFEELSRSYHALRDEVERASDRDLARDFQPVTEAYLDVEREMNRSDRRRSDRYAGY
jgi:chromosome segregation ATPase